MEFIDLKAQQALIKDKIDARIASVLEHGRYIMGPEIQELEERLADYAGVKHCVSLASGTDALLVALMALGVGPGDEVVVVPYTWISTAEVVALVGATPVFVDVEETTWNLDPSLLEAAISEKTKAIIPVGIYGQPANLTAINEIAGKHGDIPVIEDAAQCFGSEHFGKKSGGLTQMGCTSFFPSKPLGCYGDGGATFTDDDELAQKMRQIRVHGQEKKHWHPILGLNGRMDTLQAAILLPKLDIFDEEIGKRQQVASAYSAAIQGNQRGIQTPVVGEGNTSVWAQYTILSPEREELKQELSAKGIPSVSYYATPLHLQPVFADLGHSKGDFPVSEKISDQCLSLPMNPYLSEADIAQVCESFQS
ncbi:MAG: DegT/DnrJ/EryC1/StrS family aminotransferase [Roseibacillus sp.]